MARAPQNPIQKFKEVIIDDVAHNRCYLVCYTVTINNEHRVTSIIECRGTDTDDVTYHRIIRTDDPKLWLDIRSHI